MKKVFTGLFFLSFLLFRTYGQQTYADFTFDVVCDGQPTILTSTSTHLAGDSILLYLWDLNGDLVFETSGPQLKVVTITVDSVQEVGHKIYTLNGLMESKYKMVPATMTFPDFGWENTCHFNWTYFYDKSVVTFNNIETWDWNFGDGTSGNQMPIYHTYQQPGIYTVQMSFVTFNGCKDTISKLVTIDPNPDFELSYSMAPEKFVDNHPHFKFYKGQNLEVTVNTTYTDIVWTPNTLSGSKVNIDESGDYMVRVTNEFGCFTDRKFSVEVIDDYTVNPMKVITPYNDGPYSKFKIKWFIQPDEKFEVKIYNRYGDEVYSNSDYQNDWDGTHEGNLIPEGSYYYYIKANDGKVYKGAVNVVRQ